MHPVTRFPSNPLTLFPTAHFQGDPIIKKEKQVLLGYLGKEYVPQTVAHPSSTFHKQTEEQGFKKMPKWSQTHVILRHAWLTYGGNYPTTYMKCKIFPPGTGP